jgi:hypothetical protein
MTDKSQKKSKAKKFKARIHRDPFFGFAQKLVL